MPMTFSAAELRNQVFIFMAVLSLFGVQSELPGASQTGSWSLASPNGKCIIKLSLGSAGNLTYSAFQEGSLVLKESPLGLIRDDESFESALTFRSAEKPMPKREQYQL